MCIRDSLNGLQVGIITNVSFVSETNKSVIVSFELNNPNLTSISLGSIMQLNSDLLSGPYLDIVWNDTTAYYNDQDTVLSTVSMALEDQINERLLPLEKKTNELISTADSAIKTIEAIFSRNTDNLDESFDGIKNAIRNKILSEDAMIESITSFKRSGACAIVTYFALEIAKKIKQIN